MARREYLGEFEQIVLLAILQLGDDAYGVPIRLEIERRTGRALTVGALYRTLDRLEDKKLKTKIEVTVTDTAGNSQTTTEKLKLKD